MGEQKQAFRDKLKIVYSLPSHKNLWNNQRDNKKIRALHAAKFDITTPNTKLLIEVLEQIQQQVAQRNWVKELEAMQVDPELQMTKEKPANIISQNNN